MAEKICLDTDACIAVLKNDGKAEKLINAIAQCQVFVASITVFELCLRKENLDKIQSFLNDVFVLDFDENSAVMASNIYKGLKAKGRLLDLRDIFIASAAITNKCVLATFNQKHFSRITDLKLLDF